MDLRARVACILLLLANAAWAGPFTDIVVFGDSLSDVGNTNASTFGLQPGSNYFEGRFSNGPVYAERLAAGLGLGPLTRSDGSPRGDNYAYAGAETNGPGGFTGLFLDSLVEQVDEYLGRLGAATPDPGTLFVVFIGANDLFGGQTNVATPVGVIRTQLERLVAAGARRLLGINLPLLGLTPDYNTRPADAAAIDSRTRSFNSALEGAYDAIEAGAAGATVHRLDVESLFSDLVADAAALGFTNTTQQGRPASGGSLNGAPGYVFWDGVHPTRETHALLGEAAIRAVLPEGDYDRDGVLESGDYDPWRRTYGTAFNALLGQTPSLGADGNGDGRIDAADYTLWRDVATAAATAVPEPATGTLIAVVGVLAWRRLRRAPVVGPG